jgi:glucose-6-phosphate isomerase
MESMKCTQYQHQLKEILDQGELVHLLEKIKIKEEIEEEIDNKINSQVVEQMEGKE